MLATILVPSCTTSVIATCITLDCLLLQSSADKGGHSPTLAMASERVSTAVEDPTDAHNKVLSVVTHLAPNGTAHLDSLLDHWPQILNHDGQCLILTAEKWLLRPGSDLNISSCLDTIEDVPDLSSLNAGPPFLNE